SKGTYVADVVMPLLRATLEDFPDGNLCLSTAERQSLASKAQRNPRIEKKLDVMVLVKHEQKVDELVYTDEEKTKNLSETVSLQELNSKLIVIIAELRRENSEIKTENIELKAENSMVCNQIVTNVSQDVEPGISDSYPVNSNDVPEDINLLCDDIDITNNASNSDEHQEETSSRVSNLSSTALAICVKPKSLEGKEIDNFLIEKHNEQICNEIREKKLQHRPPTESSPKEDTYIFNIKSSIPPEQKKEQGLIQEISTSIKDQNDITRISQNNVRQNHMTEVASDQDIICLYQNA
ncbi:11180_t:CDS:2, partial [Racocetra persica]